MTFVCAINDPTFFDAGKLDPRRLVRGTVFESSQQSGKGIFIGQELRSVANEFRAAG